MFQAPPTFAGEVRGHGLTGFKSTCTPRGEHQWDWSNFSRLARHRMALKLVCQNRPAHLICRPCALVGPVAILSVPFPFPTFAQSSTAWARYQPNSATDLLHRWSALSLPPRTQLLRISLWPIVGGRLKIRDLTVPDPCEGRPALG